MRTDKWGAHWYAQHYQKHFAPLRRKPIHILEIGIGGEGDASQGGESLRMWKKFFPRGLIVGLDIHDKSHFQEDRIKIYCGSQDDPALLERIVREIGHVDIVIDDGSHMNLHVLCTFQTLFPLLSNGGFYAVEDTQTSYWEVYGGHPDPRRDENTMMGCFKSLADGLNYKEYREPGSVPSYFEANIVAMHFYHNLVLIEKGSNDE